MQDVSTEHKHQVTAERGRKRIGQGGNKDKTHKGPTSPERPEAEFVISKLSVNFRWLQCYFLSTPFVSEQNTASEYDGVREENRYDEPEIKTFSKKFEFDRRPSDFDQLHTNRDVNQNQVRTQDSIFNAR
ncbi:hypothetical protein D9C73_022695 [Collichthys lucidus]|uniref:Uncharacterized protein n=1 Tax=Collichthys lucidus TaxID=240159 RepID=A0A4U5VKE3_COLLU|nr:hypothetical protein D9C73_022695 [Collichthys lucidus]